MKESTLKNHYNKIKWIECKDYDTTPLEKFPACPGYLIIELIKRYKIPFKALGFYHNIVAIKTQKRAMIWRDIGVGATFLGLINIEGGTVEIKEDKEKPDQKTKPFDTFEGLNKEIRRRDYSNILGLRASVTTKEYWHFLEVLPPLKRGKNWFILSEALSDELYYKFFEYGNTCHICEVVKVEQEELRELEAV